MTTRTKRVSILAGLFAVLSAAPAAAQTIRASAVDAATGAPLAEAMIRVEAEDGSLAAAGFTRSDGSVTLRVRRPGPYRVQATRSGYHPGAVAVQAAGGEVRVAVRMAQRPFALDTVVVFGQTRDERGRQGFERRRSLGLGVFLDSAYLEPRMGGAAYVGDMLRGVPGTYLQRGRGVTVPRSLRGWRCMVMLIDGYPLSMRFDDGGSRELHHVIGPTDIKSVEIYREWSEVPPEFQRWANNGFNNCGVYLYWTRAGW
ncbi:MAG TPA: carboxypeptidase regulatory-like domain-containing protein [Longimicrobium sp.]|jgi:hypothetical protein|uniref:carboxypeptidase-like regulatory domain-containing protein n=1 Tax=Longimicrobium sp. TaxID=2029185 RepID=UPI002ED97466